jgi:transcriptional regulator with XRE-family HTH domain
VEPPGAFIRGQRKPANLPLREPAEMTRLPNPHLSQTERGLHQPSVRVLKLISGALGVPGETLLAQAGRPPAAAPARNIPRCRCGRCRRQSGQTSS